MKHDQLLREITLFCERHGIAESTLGRLAVNDGKFVQRAMSSGKKHSAARTG